MKIERRYLRYYIEEEKENLKFDRTKKILSGLNIGDDLKPV